MKPETESKGKIYYAHPVTHAFLLEAINSGVIEELWEEDRKHWPRRIRMVYDYFFSSLTYQEIGNEYGSTGGENARMTIKRAIERVRERCPEATREKYPLDEIKMKKTNTPQVLRERARRRDGKFVRMADLISIWGLTPEEIVVVDEDITGQDLVDARLLLRDWGVEIPYRNASRRVYPALVEALRKTEDIEVTQSLLDQVDRNLLIADRRRGEESATISLREAAKNLYYRSPDTEVVLGFLREAGIPVGMVQRMVKTVSQAGTIKQRYFFISRKHSVWAEEVLSQEAVLARFGRSPIEQIAGSVVSEEKRPTAWQIGNRKRYGLSSLKNIIESCAIPVGGYHGLRIKDVLGENCPVPVFRLHNQHVAWDRDVEELKGYITSRKDKLDDFKKKEDVRRI